VAQQRGRSESGKPGHAAPGGAPDITRDKTAAEIEKIEQEAKKLKRETEAVLPADIVKGKAEAEIKKAKLDAEKLEREARHFWMEPVKVITGVSSILLGLVAVGGLWVSFQTSLQTAQKAERDAQRLEREVVSSLVKDLGAEQRALRATSALRLGYYVTDEKLGAGVVASLIASLVGEGEPEVQEAILQALEPARQAVRSALTDARGHLDGQIVQLFSDIDPSTGLPSPPVERKIQGKQQAMIKITFMLAASTQCKTSPCPADFSNLQSLRRSLFLSYRDRLKGANFANAAVLESDFYGVDLSGAHFEGASLQASSFIRSKLDGAKFDGANIRLIQHPIRGTLHRAEFRNADLTGASFVESCLGGADFTESNVDPVALARGFTEGVLIESEKLAKLGPLRSHDKCRVVRQ
jgi:Pentapeptide repeats (8 copies)